MSDLKPCPFCGSTNISIGEAMGQHADGKYFIQTCCLDCMACGPEAPTEPESGVLWNTSKDKQ